MIGDAEARVLESWQTLRDWILASYERAPALVLGLAALLAVPPLAVIGLLLKGRERPPPDATYLQSRRGRTSKTGDGRSQPATEGGPVWPSEAWIEFEGEKGGLRHGIGRSVVRIGREGDNDICLSDMTVHRYHAAIHRTDDAEFMVTDLSSADGNGVLVNGQRHRQARLNDGDVIELGHVRLKFIAKPA